MIIWIIVHDRALVVVAGHPDKDVRGIDLLDALGGVAAQSRVVMHAGSSFRYFIFPPDVTLATKCASWGLAGQRTEKTHEVRP